MVEFRVLGCGTKRSHAAAFLLFMYAYYAQVDVLPEVSDKLTPLMGLSSSKVCHRLL